MLYFDFLIKVVSNRGDPQATLCNKSPSYYRHASDLSEYNDKKCDQTMQIYQLTQVSARKNR